MSSDMDYLVNFKGVPINFALLFSSFKMSDNFNIILWFVFWMLMQNSLTIKHYRLGEANFFL
jgi:hypothetical protein